MEPTFKNDAQMQAAARALEKKYMHELELEHNVLIEQVNMLDEEINSRAQAYCELHFWNFMRKRKIFNEIAELHGKKDEVEALLAENERKFGPCAVKSEAQAESPLEEISYEEAKQLLTKDAFRKEFLKRYSDIYKKSVSYLMDGDRVIFGNYEWKVLTKDEKKALIITTEPIGKMPYDTSRDYITWEKCTLRQWLNNEFYNSFSEIERSAIMTTRLEDAKSKGNATQDKIFLLSIDEAKTYFADSEARNLDMEWWLRSPGNGTYLYAAVVDLMGAIGYIGQSADCERAVRPALVIKL